MARAVLTRIPDAKGGGRASLALSTHGEGSNTFITHCYVQRRSISLTLLYVLDAGRGGVGVCDFGLIGGCT